MKYSRLLQWIAGLLPRPSPIESAGLVVPADAPVDASIPMDVLAAVRIRQRGSSTMAIMGRHGDTKVLWDVADTTAEGRAAVQEAKRIFTDHRSRGYLAYRVDNRDGGGKIGGERITSFDAEATDLLLIPPVVGG